MSNQALQGKFGMEFALPRNGNAYWPLTLETLRGRWESSYVSGQSPSEQIGRLHQSFPVIRGVCIEVDTVKRRARIFDPYAPGEEEADKWEKLNLLVESVPVAGKLGMEPMRSVETKEMSADQLKDWMYQCRKHIEGGKAIPLTGKGYREWPSLDDVKKMPGKCRANFYTGAIDGSKEFEHTVPVTVGA